MKIKPLHNNVVIKQHENQDEKYGNILVPDTGKEKPLQGVVIAVGPGHYSMTGFIHPKVKEGDVVIFPTFGGIKITVDKEEYIVCKETDLIAVLEETHELPVSMKKETVHQLLEDTKQTISTYEKENLKV